MIGWLLLFVFTVHTNQEQNALTSRWQLAIRSNVQTISPQQWAFFTKSPRDPTYEPYSIAEGSWRKASTFPHSKVENAFGWNRESRAQAIELGLIMSQVRGSDWKKCGRGIPSCLDNADSHQSVVRISNPSPAPTLCGRIGIVESSVAPWAWAEIGQEAGHPRAMVAEISC